MLGSQEHEYSILNNKKYPNILNKILKRVLQTPCRYLFPEDYTRKWGKLRIYDPVHPVPAYQVVPTNSLLELLHGQNNPLKIPATGNDDHYTS